MNLTESIKHLMSEGKLKWKATDEDTGAQEATLSDGTKFAIHNITGTLSVMYVGKDGKGNVIYRTPAGVPMAFMKAKQEAEKFLGIKGNDSKKESEFEEELGSENEWGTDELTDKEKAVTPGQTPKKESLEKACWKGYKAIGTKEKDGKTVPNCVPEAIGQSGMDVASLATKMGFKKPSVRDVGGRKSYLFKNVMHVKLSASLENAGYPEVEAYTYGDGFVTDHKKGDVILRVGPAERGASSWLTIMSDYKTESTDEELDPGAQDAQAHMADIESIKRLIAHPDTTLAIENYGSVEKYREMLRAKLAKLQGVKNEAVSGAEQVTLKPSDKLEVKYGTLLVNGRQFEVSNPDESVDWPKSIDGDGKLVTWFKGRPDSVSTWAPEEITGRYTDKEESSEEKPEISERYVKTVQLITKETDRSLIEAFLTEHTIAGRESNLLAINTEFKRFKKFHQQ